MGCRYDYSSSLSLATLLIFIGALTFDKLERVILDTSHIDQKKRGMFDMRETQQPLMQLLNVKDIRDRYSRDDGEVRLLFF